MEYRNPVLTGFYPDPSICRAGNDYYMVTSSFEYLPGIPVFHSRDLVNWEQVGHCLTRKEQMTFPEAPASGGIYASTIRYHQGKFYVTSTNTSAQGHTGNFIVSAEDPAGEWSDPVWVEQGGIDPSLFFDKDGTAYYTSNGMFRDHSGVMRNMIQQSVISAETGEILRGPEVISLGTGGRCAEGPHLYRKDGMYYLLLAEGGTELGHMETIFRSENPFGPFQPCPGNPILTARDENRPELAAAGHADIVEDADGRYWMVFLCYRTIDAKFHHLGRETSIVPLIWEEGTWPQIPGGRAPRRLVRCLPEREVAQRDLRRSFYDDFSGTRKLDWNTIREYCGEIETGKEGLRIKGSRISLWEQKTPSFLGVRQKHMRFLCSTDLRFMPETPEEEAGLCVLYSNTAYYSFRIVRGKKGFALSLRRRIHDMETEQRCLELKEGRAEIAVMGEEADYHFGVMENGEFLELAKADTRLLSTEVNRGFTGVYIGLYASGNGENCRKPAVFSYFRYKGQDDEV